MVKGIKEGGEVGLHIMLGLRIYLRTVNERLLLSSSRGGGADIVPIG